MSKKDLLDLTQNKYDICILIDVVNGVDTGKITQVWFGSKSPILGTDVLRI